MCDTRDKCHYKLILREDIEHSEADKKRYYTQVQEYLSNEEWRNESLFIPRAECSNCEGSGDSGLRKCTGCRIVKYCSKQCQREHWHKHKETCQYLKSISGAVNNSKPHDGELSTSRGLQKGSLMIAKGFPEQVVGLWYHSDWDREYDDEDYPRGSYPQGVRPSSSTGSN